MEVAVLHRVGFLAYFCPKQGQDFKPSAAPLYPNMGQVPPPGHMLTFCSKLKIKRVSKFQPGLTNMNQFKKFKLV